ncbi:MAG: NAD-dependent epimerase/dehydratase family protein [Streptosporangiales bacterium]|nr:NAD-dependent epimerase/dehydratase family protein [Streptosporangiales bacterium]
MTRTVLVTGVSRYLGARVANTLQADPAVGRVIGIDAVPPKRPLGRTEFVRVDLRTSGIAALIESASVDTVVHLSLVATPAGAGGRMSMKESNVIGAMQLLGACQRAPSVRRLVVRSTSAVYGASPRDPGLFTESMEPHETPKTGYAKDAAEVEGYVRGLGRRRPDLWIAVLRFANFMGPTVDSPLTRYLRMPVVPTVLGFDPRLQFVHEDDGVDVIRRMATSDHTGLYNVAGHGVLLLSQCLRRAGRVELPLPAPLLRYGGGVARQAGLSDFSPEQLALLAHGRVMDCGKLERTLDWTPAHTTAEAYDDFVRTHGDGRNAPVEALDRLTEQLRAVMGR